ncbi:ATP-binding protein [Thiofilum flexile]|uniref:ATP-binding protein n=1 Tax=Thiofilum flexile TaxID=125627 RepID=UPI0003623A70|nr:ATP-binding protein [Thiofilum flexile]
MNLFVEDLAHYLIQEWKNIQQIPGGTKEARFVVESLSPENTFALLHSLEEYRSQVAQQARIECHFKVAKGLWDAWLKHSHESRTSLTQKMQALGGVDNETGALRWIDEDDRLTWYRNLTKPADKDGLVVVLIGLDHTSDQGGLMDFHLVDETRIWSQMEQNYQPWLKRLAQRVGIFDPLEADIIRFESALQELFAIKPRRLLKLAEFLEIELIPANKHVDSLSEVLASFYEHLPFWGVPPLCLSTEQVKKVRETKDLIKSADALISHQKLKSRSDQDKAWSKIEKLLQDPEFTLPEVFGEAAAYTDIQDYGRTLKSFIYNADAQARERLVHTNLVKLIKQLKVREKSKKVTSEKKVRLQGSSMEVFLRAIWETVLLFAKACQEEGEVWTDYLSEIQVVVDQFNHDLETDIDTGIAGSELAKELLQGCLGGLEQLLETYAMDLRLPVDEEQVALPMAQWQRHINVVCRLEPDDYRVSRKRPHLRFRVLILSGEEGVEYTCQHEWALEATHAERVRYQCAKLILENWPAERSLILPALQLSSEELTALYFAADEEEAHRLINNALGMLKIIDLMEGMRRNEPHYLDTELNEQAKALSQAYRAWLVAYVKQGYYYASNQCYLHLQTAYANLAKSVLDKSRQGSAELLRRFYKAFLLFSPTIQPNNNYMHSAVVLGTSPAVLELTWKREMFLRDYFKEVIAEYTREQDIKAPKTKQALERLLNLVTIQRPLAGLVVDNTHKLSAKIKSFNLLHYLGEEPSGEKSLAVQTLLREDDDNEDNLSEVKRSSEDSRIIMKILKDYYLPLYAFAADGVRIIAVHVDNVSLILSGLDLFLHYYLEEKVGFNQPAFFCELMVYSTSSSPISVEKKLTLWRDDMVEKFREKRRRLNLSVGHRFAPKREDIIELLNKEERLYDIAFLFNFLGEDMIAEVEAAEPFVLEAMSNLNPQFPISEYPRPIRQGDEFKRQSLLSDRRLCIQTRHADLSARLRHPGDEGIEHLMFGSVNYEPWQKTVEALHQKAQWVACVDPFIDKRLLGKHINNSQRKIVGFTSGLGAYGELNLSISTEQDTLTHLALLVKKHLHILLPIQSGQSLDITANKIVAEAEEIIGLSSLRAVVGNGEKIREVVGFAAIRRMLARPPQAVMTQLLPLDAFQHWFNGSDAILRPDLLQLSLTLRDDNIPLIEAMVIECKLAKESECYVQKAVEQVEEGLKHLTQLFAPFRQDIRRPYFDRRYWWAQLQRALASRTVVALPDDGYKKLNIALEKMVDGDYEIAWSSSIFTFWTDIPDPKLILKEYALSPHVLTPPFVQPEGFVHRHWIIGYKGLLGLFGDIGLNSSATTEVLPVLETKQGMAESELIVETVGEADTDLQSVATTLEQTDISTPIQDQELSPIETSNVNKLLPSVPEKLLIGTNAANGEPVYWYYGHPGLANRHLLLFGSSGSGKTYGIQCLLAEMAAQQLHSAIIDYTDGFLPSQVEQKFAEVTQPDNYYVRTDKLPLNPFRRQIQVIDPNIPAMEESAFDVASRITSIFTSVFNMGDQQAATLTRVLEVGISNERAFTLDDLLPMLRDEGSVGETLANKLEPFVRSQPFRASDSNAWEGIFGSADHWVNILQLKGLSRDTYRIVTEFALWDLYDYACNTGSKNRPLPVVLDEIQNLNHSSDSPIDKMLREGRKFGLSLILATQTTSNFDQEQRDRLFQAGHKLFFKPADTEIKSFAKILSMVSRNVTEKEWEGRLSKLTKGQCYSLGPVLTSNGTLRTAAILVSVTALEQRNFN